MTVNRETKEMIYTPIYGFILLQNNNFCNVYNNLINCFFFQYFL